MPTTTFHEPPPPFACAICAQPSYLPKAGKAVCEHCPSFTDHHYFPAPVGEVACDVFFLGDSPLVPRLTLLHADREPAHVTFNDAAGKVVQAAVKQLRESGRFGDIRCRYAYAVRCATDTPNKAVINACGANLRAEFNKVLAARKDAGKTAPLVIVAHGTTALRALGIAAQSETEAAGQVYDITMGDTPFKVVASRSMKSVVGAIGKYSSLVADIERAFDLANLRQVVKLTQEELERTYRYPRTVEEVGELVDEIIAYGPSGQDPAEWAISIDTETNTLFPHRDGLQLTIVSVAWGPGRAAAIPLWHADTPYDPALAWQHVLRLLRCRKKKIFHNAKYDMKVFWKLGVEVERLYWDVMLAEHALEEDKKGQYGLKYLVKQFLPKYAGYEDQIYEKLAAVQGERQLDNIRKSARLPRGKTRTESFMPELPEAAKEALTRLGLTEGFRSVSITARIKKLKTARDVAAQVNQNVLWALQSLQYEPPYKGAGFERTLEEHRRMAARYRTRAEETGVDPSYAEERFIQAVKTIPKELKRFDYTPFTEEQAAELAALELVAKYVAAGYFKKTVRRIPVPENTAAPALPGTVEVLAPGTEVVAEEAKSGGFEKIPLWETKKESNGAVSTDYTRGVQLFYAAVDADVTRQLAIMQHQRMRAEEALYLELRAKARKQVEMERRSPGGCAFEVRPLCSIAQPVINLTKHGYVPRAIELARTEYDGVKVDLDYVDRSMAKLTRVINQETQRLYALAGEEVKLGDSRRIGLLLFDIGRGYKPTNPDKACELAAKFPGRVKWTGERLMYKGVSWTEKGAVQTTEKVLKTLAMTYDCEFANSLLLLRKATKARDTFFKNTQLLARHDGRLHTSYNLNGTATGRLSSSDINMQNIPKGEMGGMAKTDPRYHLTSKEDRAGVNCKRMFIPDDDSLIFVNADAKGAEVKIFAAYSKDPALIAALREGMDAHSFFSSIILNPNKVAEGLTGTQRAKKLKEVGIDDLHAWSYKDFESREDYIEQGIGPEVVENGRVIRGNPDDNTTWADPALVVYGKTLKKLRDVVKRVVFGILFGAGPRKIAEIVGIEESLARDVIALLFKMFPTLPKFIEQTRWELGVFGRVETYFGRQRRFAIEGAPRELLSRAQRQAVNFKIQSSNSDIVLDCYTHMAPMIRSDFGGRMYLTVHDSLGFGVKKKYASQLKDFIREHGTTRVARLCPWLPVDYLWDVEAGSSYGDLMPVDKYIAAHKTELDALNEPYVEEEMFDAFRAYGEGDDELSQVI